MIDDLSLVRHTAISFPPLLVKRERCTEQVNGWPNRPAEISLSWTSNIPSSGLV